MLELNTAGVDPVDRLFLERACELARRGLGNTSPNPPVGAVVVRDGRIIGEGYHHRAGEPHAEVLALRDAGERSRGATLYLSLEPCNHHGRTPPCSPTVAQSGVARVVVGAEDPNPKTAGAGIAYLRAHGVDVAVENDASALDVIEPFAHAIRSERPYVSLKMAMSLDGYVASKPGRQDWLTGTQAREFVRELRIVHDAVAVGAGTVRVDNPQLTVRPPHHRVREYVRIVMCESETVEPDSAIFDATAGYVKTIVLAPAGSGPRFAALRDVADVVLVGPPNELDLDIAAALRSLRERGITSVLCEGGPTMAGHLCAHGLVDRFYWLLAPRLLRSEHSVPVLTAGALADVRGLRFDRVERLGPDVLVSGMIERHV